MLEVSWCSKHWCTYIQVRCIIIVMSVVNRKHWCKYMLGVYSNDSNCSCSSLLSFPRVCSLFGLVFVSVMQSKSLCKASDGRGAVQYVDLYLYLLGR